MFINYRQELWLEWLEIARFAYNNKVHSVIKIFLFKANTGQELQIGFKIRKKRRFEKAEEFTKKVKKVQKEVRVALQKVQEKMKRYTDRKQKEAEVLESRILDFTFYFILF